MVFRRRTNARRPKRTRRLRRFLRSKSVRRFKRRGEQSKRISVRRYGVANPFGDKAMVKLKFNYANYFQGDAASFTVEGPIYPINDLAALYSYVDTISKGYLTYPKLFRRCRVNGVMARLTIFSVTQEFPYPVMAFMQPWSDDEGNPTVNNKTASTLKQQRWTKTGYVRNWAAGGGPTTISQFFGVKKLMGSDIARTSLAYTSITDTSGNPYNSPTEKWNLNFGVTSAGQVVLPVSASFHYNLELTYYVEYFEQIREQTGV